MRRCSPISTCKGAGKARDGHIVLGVEYSELASESACLGTLTNSMV